MQVTRAASPSFIGPKYVSLRGETLTDAQATEAAKLADMLKGQIASAVAARKQAGIDTVSMSIDVPRALLVGKDPQHPDWLVPDLKAGNEAADRVEKQLEEQGHTLVGCSFHYHTFSWPRFSISFRIAR